MHVGDNERAGDNMGVEGEGVWGVHVEDFHVFVHSTRQGNDGGYLHLEVMHKYTAMSSGSMPPRQTLEKGSCRCGWTLLRSINAEAKERKM